MSGYATGSPAAVGLLVVLVVGAAITYVVQRLWRNKR
jgi:hypothetical protein